MPDRDAVPLAQVVETDRLGKSADASGFDVDDAARACGDRFLGDVDGLDRLVEADGRLQPPLQRRVVGDVVVVERLLDHHEIECVEPREVRRVRDGVRGVGVHHQRHRSEPRPDHRDGVDVPAGFDLDLDPPVAGGELPLDERGEIVERILYADRHARRDARARAAEHPRQRRALLPREQVPRGHLDGRLRHVVAANGFQRGKHVAGMRELRPDDARRDELRDDVPRRLVRLGAVVRILLRDALAVSARAALVGADDDEMFVVDAAETRLEEADERELHERELQTFDPHGAMISSAPCNSGTSRSKDRSARARPRLRSDSARGSTPRSFSKNPRIRSSPIFTPTARAPRCRRSSSSC